MATETTSVRCQQCGSPLSIRKQVRFVSCNYCRTELEVHWDADVTHTSVLKALRESSEETLDRLKIVELQNEIAALERGWENWRQQNLKRRKDGSLVEPMSPTSKTLRWCAAAVGGIAAAVVVGVGVGPLPGLVIGVAGAFFIYFAASAHANDTAFYERNRDRYQSQRLQLQAELARFRSELRDPAG